VICPNDENLTDEQLGELWCSRYGKFSPNHDEKRRFARANAGAGKEPPELMHNFEGEE